MRKWLWNLWCSLVYKCPKCGEPLACNENSFSYGLWYCPNCDGNCEEEIGVAESPLKTFPRVNVLDEETNYRH